MKKILIVFGYKQREYEYLIFLKSFLHKYGFDVKIRYMNFECYYEVFSWKPDFVILNQVNQNENIEFAKYSKRSGARIIVLNAELLYLPERIRIKYAPDCNQYVDYTIEAGNRRVYEIICKYSHLDHKKIKMIGTPKLDLYLRVIRKNMRIFKPFSDMLKHNRKTICICTSFSHANVSWDKVKDNIAYKNIGQKKLNIIVRSHRRQQQSYMELAEKLALTNKYNIIFRVHPLEDPKPYIQKLKNYPNIIIDNFVHQRELFEVVDLLIHRSSTMAIEAWIYNIQTVTFDPINSSDMKLFSLTRFERVFHIIPPLMKYVSEYMKGKDTNNWQKDRIKYLKDELGFSVMNKVSVSEKISIFLASIKVLVKTKVYHRFIFTYVILNFLRILIRKKYIYEVIGLIKGSEYLRIYKENFV